MTASAEGTSDANAGRSVPWKAIILVALLAAALFALYRLLPIADWIAAFQSWVEGYGWWGVVAFVLVYAGTVFLLVPGSFLTLAAGVVWGLWAFPIVVVAATLGSALSFLAARHVFFERVQGKVGEYPRFAAVNAAIGEEGWRVVGLLRLSPALPFSLQNWFLGVTPVGFWPSQIATFLGIMPGTLLYVWIGSLGNAAGEGASTAKFAGFAVGIAATVAVMWIVTRKAKAKMAEFEARGA